MLTYLELQFPHNETLKFASYYTLVVLTRSFGLETTPTNVEDWGKETANEEWVLVEHPVEDPLFPDALATSATGSETHDTTCSEERQHTFISESR